MKRWFTIFNFIMLILSFSLPALAVSEGDYKGVTSQDRYINFTVSGNQIVNVKLSLYHRLCGVSIITSLSGPFTIDQDNTFVITGYMNSCPGGQGLPSYALKYWFNGEFTSETACTGTWLLAFGGAEGTWEAEKDIPRPIISVSPDTFLSTEIIAEKKSFDFLYRCTDLTYKEGYLWILDDENYQIHKVDNSGNIIGSLDISVYKNDLSGLEYDGNCFYILDWINGKIRKYDSSLNYIESFNAFGNSPYALSFDDSGNLWQCDCADDEIFNLDTSGNMIKYFATSLNCPSNIAYGENHLWVTDNGDYIWKYDTSGNLVSSYNYPVSNIAYGDGYLWGTYGDKIHQIEIPDSSLTGTQKSLTYTITNSGKLDLVISNLVVTGLSAYDFFVRNDNCSGQTLATSGTATFEIVFNPTSGGEKNAILQIPSNDPSKPILEIPLSGSAVSNYKLAGDINGDTVLTLSDAIIALQILVNIDVGNSMRSDYITADIDVNGDDRVGSEEVTYILKSIINM